MGIAKGKSAGAWMDPAFWSYLSPLTGPLSWRLGLSLGLTICLSLTEGFGLLMLVPLLQLVGLDVQGGTLGRIAQHLSSLFTAAGVRPTLITVLGLYVFIISVQGLLYRWETTTNLTLGHNFVASVRQRLYRAIADTNWLFYSRERSSDFTHVLTTEVDRVGSAMYCLLNLSATAIVAIAYIVIALRLSTLMTGLVFACACLRMLLDKGRTQVARTSGEELVQAMNSLYAAATEHLSGMKTAKSHGAEDRHVEIFTNLTERVRNVNTGAIRNQAEARYWFEIGSVLVLILALYISLEVLAISTAEVLVLLFLFARILPKLSSMQQSFQQLVTVLPAFTSVMEMQARCEAAAEPRAHGTEKIELRHCIHLDRVSFGYGETPVIHDLDLTIRAGETTAIVGPSGAGKSTIADLIIGLITPSKGRVLVDGIPLSPERMRSWRDQIGYVTQDTFLFHDTIRANLLWARPDATEEEISQALRLAAAKEFVSTLPNGLDTIVGDRGVLLSGGERQRLALARALLRKPSLLLLDEATSALDSENEQRIQRDIEKLHGSMTILVISHRLSTVRRADVIHVLEKGHLVESGTWDALIAKEHGRLRELCRAQGVDGRDGRWSPGLVPLPIVSE